MASKTTTEATESTADAETPVAEATRPARKRSAYKNGNDQRINRNGYLDACEDVLAALDAGGVRAARALIAENLG